MENKGSSKVLRFFGILMIAFGLIYGILGFLALAGTLIGLLPGHENQEMLIVVLAYALTLLAVICGIACIRGMQGVSRILGTVFAVIGLVSLIYTQITQDQFSIFDCIAVVFGAAIASVARKKA